jgi:hypothetical protein
MESNNHNKNYFSQFKQNLLRSGIPLETSVARIIQKYGLIDNGEYNYERNGKIFSIDINAMGFTDFEIYYRANLINVDILIECKYREEDRKWVFLTFKPAKEYSFRVNTHNIVIDFPMQKRLNEYGYYQKYNKRKYSYYYSRVFSDYFPKEMAKVHKGVEIYKKGFNPDSITESIFKLIFGVGSSIAANVKDLCENPEEEIRTDEEYIYIGGTLGYFIIPIIVTTAKIYQLKEEITIEDIKKAKTIEEIAKEEKAVFYEQPEHLELENYINNSFTFKETMIKSKFFKSETIEDQINDFKSLEPRILIINYDNFEEIFSQLLNELNFYFKELSRYWTRLRKKKR